MWSLYSYAYPNMNESCDKNLEKFVTRISPAEQCTQQSLVAGCFQTSVPTRQGWPKGVKTFRPRQFPQLQRGCLSSPSSWCPPETTCPMNFQIFLTWKFSSLFYLKKTVTQTTLLNQPTIKPIFYCLWLDPRKHLIKIMPRLARGLCKWWYLFRPIKLRLRNIC